MKIKLEDYAKIPTRAHKEDAGLDLYTPIDFTIGRFGNVTIDTGVHAAIPDGCVGLVLSKSGLMVNEGITTRGVVDQGYTGAINVCLFNHTFKKKKFYAGQKIAQLVVMECRKPYLKLVEELEETDRGDNGFGSTGK